METNGDMKVSINRDGEMQLPPKEQVIKEDIMANFRKAAAVRGFKKVSLDELAAEMGISKKTVYKYFPGKKELVAACLREINSEMDRAVMDIFEEQQPSHELLVNALTNIFMQMSAGINMIQDLHRYYPELWSEFEKERAARIKSAERFIERGIAGGKFRDIDAKVAINSYIAAVQTVINPKFLRANKIHINTAYESLIALFMKGLLKSS